MLVNSRETGQQQAQYPSRAYISRRAFEHNLARARELAGDAEIMAVVKADAYGHGGSVIASWALDAGVNWLMAAQLAEALALREALGERGHILALIFEPGADLEQAIAQNIDINVGTLWALDQVMQAARAVGQPARIHVEIDTGMARGGVREAQVAEFARELRAAADSGAVQVIGVWSHLACADDLESPVTNQQLEIFERVLKEIRANGIQPQFVHIAASAGLLWHPKAHYSMVRPGIMLYGLSPNPDVATAQELGLEAVMRLEAPLISVRDVPAGTPVSYGHTAHTPKDMRLGTVPVGYADGIPRAASNSAQVLVGSERQVIMGRVCMDQFVVAALEASAGDRVVLFGGPETGAPSADEWAQKCETIGYEIVTRIGVRVPREYEE